MVKKERINLLAFDGCKIKDCDCGCNIRLGMNKKALIKFLKLIEHEFDFRINNGLKIKHDLAEYLDYIGYYGKEEF